MSEQTYWNRFYKTGEVPTNCSTFAASIINHVNKSEVLFELGCGNGRDALYFAQNGIKTVAIDIADEEITALASNSNGNPRFVSGDFTKLSTPYEVCGAIKIWLSFFPDALCREFNSEPSIHGLLCMQFQKR
jgi:hypothetical protein